MRRYLEKWSMNIHDATSLKKVRIDHCKQPRVKRFIGFYQVSFDDNCLHGKIRFIDDLVTYEAQTIKELKTAFEESAEDYIKTCRVLGREPSSFADLRNAHGLQIGMI
jgi:hypothetical protein